MVTNNDKTSVTVLLTTYNRADVLRQTLGNMAAVDRGELSVEFVVVDNNSSDNTKEVVESFVGRLPLRYLFESRQGKNIALNKALDEVEFGDIVVFTDDDVAPRKDWLTAVVDVSNRWPQHSVFGGRVYPVWPDGEVPAWTDVAWITEIGFAVHDYGQQEKPYSNSRYPFGPNLWVRREVFDDGRRFDESIGPRPGSYIMGSETSFLQQLKSDGYEIVYAPAVVVGHRVESRQLCVSNMMARAYRCGRAGPRLSGPCKREMFEKSPALWLALRLAGMGKASLGYLAGYVNTSQKSRVKMRMRSMIDIGYNIESIKLGMEKLRNRNNTNV